jgi:hypothetical protein
VPSLWPPSDSAFRLIEALGPAIIALVGALWVGNKVTSVHLLINSRMTQLLTAVGAAKFEEGAKDERQRAVRAGLARAEGRQQGHDEQQRETTHD